MRVHHVFSVVLRRINYFGYGKLFPAYFNPCSEILFGSIVMRSVFNVQNITILVQDEK